MGIELVVILTAIFMVIGLTAKTYGIRARALMLAVIPLVLLLVVLRS